MPSHRLAQILPDIISLSFPNLKCLSILADIQKYQWIILICLYPGVYIFDRLSDVLDLRKVTGSDIGSKQWWNKWCWAVVSI